LLEGKRRVAVMKWRQCIHHVCLLLLD